jgi:hypothetical protein
VVALVALVDETVPCDALVLVHVAGQRVVVLVKEIVDRRHDPGGPVLAGLERVRRESLLSDVL